MNGEFPSNNPRAELEARLTAFILGELPAHDAAALRQAMEEDAELAALYERLKAASKLVREAAENPIEQIKEPSAPLRLSEERRQKLLAQFKTVAPKEFVHASQPGIAGRRLLEIAAVLAMMGVLAGLLLPSLAKSKLKAVRVAVANNLKQIDLAKKMWADENNKSPNDVPAASDLASYMGGDGGLPKSVEGETYNIGRVGESPTADIKGKRRISLYEESASPIMRPGLGAVPRQELIAERMGGVRQDNSVTTVAPAAVVRSPPRTTIVLPPAENLTDTATLATNGYVDNSFEWNPGSGTRQPKTALPTAPGGMGGKMASAEVQDALPAVQNLFGNGGLLQNSPLTSRSTTFQPQIADGSIRQITVNGIGRMNTATTENRGEAAAVTNSYSNVPEWTVIFENSSSESTVTNSIVGRSSNLSPGPRPDVDSIHAQNQVVSASPFKDDGLSSNQGVGAWQHSALAEAQTRGGAKAPNSEFRFYSDLNGNGIADTNATLSGEVVNLGLIQGTSGGGRNDAKGLVDPTTGLPVAPLPVDAANNNNGAVAASTGPSPIDGVMAGPRPLSEPPPRVNIRAKFADVPDDDQAIDLNWGGGNFTNSGNVAIARLNSDGSLETDQSKVLQGINLAGPVLIGGEKQPFFAEGSSSTAGVGALTNPEVMTVSGTAAKTRQPVEVSFDTGASVEGEKTTVSGVTNAWHGGALLGPVERGTFGSLQQASVDQPQPIRTAPNLDRMEQNAHLPWTRSAIVTNSFVFDDQEAVGKQRGEPSVDYKLNTAGVPFSGTDYSSTNGVIEIARETGADETVRRDATRKPVPTLGDLPQLGALFRSGSNAVQTGGTNHYSRGIGVLTQRDMREGAIPSQELIEEVPAWRSNEAAKPAPEFRGNPIDTGHYTNDLGNVTVSVDPETKRNFFITDADTSADVSNIIRHLERSPAEQGAKQGKEQAQNESKDVGIQYAKASDISDALKSLGADGKKTEANKAYREKKEELGALMAEREVITKHAELKAKAPETVVVEAKPSENKNLGLKLKGVLTGQVAETAQVKPEPTLGMLGDFARLQDRIATGAYDPYFIATESEVLQSEKILDQVIDKLKLNEAWAKKEGSATPLTTSQTRQLLRRSLQIKSEPHSNVLDIKVTGDEPTEAAKIANTIAEAYAAYHKQRWEEVAESNAKANQKYLAKVQTEIAQTEADLKQLSAEKTQNDAPMAKPAVSAPVPQPEVSTSENAFSTFSLNIADVSFKLAAASLEKGRMPEAASIRSEEFINAFDYRDPEPAPGAPLGFAWERAQYPFAHNRDLLRFAVKTAAAGREPGRPLNIVLLLDKSGSMERADRVKIIHEALRVLATQLQPQDRLSVVTFARVARLWVDGLPGSQAGEVAEGLDKLTPEGGTNLEEAMRLAYETARRHYLAGGINRVVLLTDGAANLGNVDPESLKQSAEEHRKEGIALDCFGVGWEGYNDDLMEVLSRNGGGRYGFLNTPEEAARGFAAQLAGALNVAAYDVKVQVEFNPKRVTAYRQIGYAKQQLTKEQFRDNTVKAAQVGAAESGNALYTIEVNPNGEGPVATVRVRYRVPGTEDYPEHEWVVPYDGNALSLEQASPAMRLAGTASAFSEWLAMSPFAGDVTTDRLLELMRGVPEIYGADERPKKMEWMIRQAKSLEGK